MKNISTYRYRHDDDDDAYSQHLIGWSQLATTNHCPCFVETPNYLVSPEPRALENPSASARPGDDADDLCHAMKTVQGIGELFDSNFAPGRVLAAGPDLFHVDAQ